MNWGSFDTEVMLPPATRGRLGERFVRGLRWALLMIVVMSVLAFSVGLSMRPDLVFRS